MDNFFNEEFENEIQKMGLDGYLNNEFIMNENIPNTIETLDMKFNENIVSEVSNQKSKAVANTVSDMISNISETKPIEIVICDIDNQSQMTKNLNLLLKQSTLVRNLSLSSVVNDENVAIITSNYMMYYYYHLIKTHGIDYVMYLHYVSSCIDSGIEYIPTHFALPHLRDNDIHQFVVATYRKTEPHKFWGYFCSVTLTPLRKGIFEKALISSYSACQATMLMLNKTIERQHRKRNFEQQINNNGTSMLLDNSYEPIVTYASCSIPGHGSCTTIAGNGCYLNNACISTSLLLKELMNGNYKCENGNLFDLSLCIGASWIYKGYRGTIDALKQMTKPGGIIIIGEPYWLKEPDTEYLQMLGIEKDEYSSHHGNIDIGENSGLHCLSTLVSNHDDWDYYETLQWWSAMDYISKNPGDQDNHELLKRIKKAKKEYLQYGRDALNWAIYVFMKQ